MGDVITLSRVRLQQSAEAAGTDVDMLVQRFESIVQAIDVQKAEIAEFRSRMEQLRSEMRSLDSSLSLYQKRVAAIPHKQLHHQARRLEMLVAGSTSDPAQVG